MSQIELQGEHRFSLVDKLALSSWQLKAVLDAIDAPILVVDENLVVRFASKKLGKLWGIDTLSLIGMNKKEAITNKIKYLFKDPEGFQERLFLLYNHPYEIAIDEVIMISPEERFFSRFSGPILDNQGNYLGRVEVYTDVTKLQSVENQLKQRNEELLAFKKIAIDIGQSLDLSEIMKRALTGLIELLGFTCGCIVPEEDISNLDRTFVCQKIDPRVFNQIITILENIILFSSDMPKDEVIIIKNKTPAMEMIQETISEKIQVIVIIPLLSNGKLQGRMYLLSETENLLVDERRVALGRIGSQIGAALENAKLYEKVQQVAILEERERLSRELHDYLAQMLGYIGLNLLLIDNEISSNRIYPARTSLAELKKIVDETYTSVRESIFNLRAPVNLGKEFLPSLRTFLEDYHTYYGLNVSLEIDNDRPIIFSPDIDIQLIRIIQEALSNTRKHSEATQALVRISQSTDEVMISIEDNGKGFKPEFSFEKHQSNIGLQVMRERAESIGGTLEIDSRIGIGTRVLVSIKQAS